MTVEFVNAGASARVRLRAGAGRQKVILFGGDLGRYNRPVLPDPSPISEADYLLIESTYGDRLHVPDDEGSGSRRS